jgi:hypothetical protein
LAHLLAKKGIFRFARAVPNGVMLRELLMIDGGTTPSHRQRTAGSSNNTTYDEQIPLFRRFENHDVSAVNTGTANS